MNADELIERVAEKNNTCPNPVEHFNPLEGALWFIAVAEARGIFDAWSVKDMAHAILGGDALFPGGLKTKEDIERWIEEKEEFDGEDTEHAWDWLEDELNRHFGIK